jgi:hypothetical protein
MIKTLRKVWKNDWGKAALIGTGLVGYGAFTSAQQVANLSKQLGTTNVGFLADVQNLARDVVMAPIEFGQVLSTSGYGYLTGKNPWSTFKGGVQSAFGMAGDPKNYGTFARIGKSLFDRSKQGGGPGGAGDSRIVHRPIQNVSSAGTVANIKAGPWEQFNKQRLAHNTMSAVRMNPSLYSKIVQQAHGVVDSGTNISVKESGQLALTRPSFRYTA